MMYIPNQLIGAPVDTQVENIFVRQELNKQHIQRQPVQLKQLAHLGDGWVHNWGESQGDHLLGVQGDHEFVMTMMMMVMM